MEELERVSEELDKVLLEFFNEWSGYSQLRSKLSNFMKDGFLSISKSRYSMGVAYVSELQIPDQALMPLVEFRPTEDTDGQLKFEVYDALENKCEVKVEDETDRESSQSKESSVRRRKIHNKLDATEDIPESDQSRPVQHETSSSQQLVNENNKTQERKDPLKWFGVLVPFSLRQSQQCFQYAAKIACDIANSKIKLDNLIEKYMKLKETKANLKKSG